MIDRFYYSTKTVDRLTVSRFYGYTLEDTGPGALRQLAPYLQYGHMLSPTQSRLLAMLGKHHDRPHSWSPGTATSCRTVPSTELTFAGTGHVPTRRFMRFWAKPMAMCRLRPLATWSEPPCCERLPPIIRLARPRQPGAGPSPQAVSH